MNSKISLLVSFYLLFYSANAFNITNLLGQYPDFSNFSNYLTQTQVAGEINGRQTITVLAVDNSGMAPLSGKPADVLKKIMRVHVVLDYFDVPKLQKLSNNTAILSTLYQASGQAAGQQGFLNVTAVSSGAVVFASAVHGSTLGANLVKTVGTQPYNISVLQISTVIIPSGIDGSNSTSPAPASPVPAASPGKSATPPSTSPARSPATAPPKSSKAPAPGPSHAIPTPAAAPPQAGEAPAPAVADVPAGSPPQPADGPNADAPAADAPAGKPAGGAISLRLSLGVVMIIVLSTLSLA